MPELSPSVLIIRLDAIGDALALTPSIAALRRYEIPVDVVLRPSNALVFSARALREVIVSEFALRSDAHATLEAIERLGRELRSREYTHVLVATEDPGGYRLAAAVGAPVRVGFEDPLGKPLKALWTRRLLTQSVYRSARLTAKSAHECETLFHLVAPLVDEATPTRDLSQLRPLVLDSEPAPDGRVAVQITHKWERLGIPLESVVELVRRLASACELRLLSSINETAYADAIQSSTGLSVSAFDDVASWKSAIAAADAIVTPDSGALHVAGMIGTPVVAVFPPTRDFAAQVARWSPWAAPHRIVRAGEQWPTRAADALAQLLG
ncbi:MAG: glycosyltransferase family 9 protein [Candidatus Cybelea sp.]